MKTVNCLLIICLLFSACSNEQEQEQEQQEQEQETIFQYGVLFPENLEYMNMPRPDDSYNYPVYPGMEEWAKFETGQEMMDACQIPSRTVRNMSTQALIQAIWEHPLLFDTFTRYLYQRDFEAMFADNNAYMELCKRRDAADTLADRLIRVNPLTRFESQTLELLMAQPVILAKLSDEERKKVVRDVLQKDDLRQKTWEDNSYAYGLKAITWLLIGRTMTTSGYVPFVRAVNENEDLKAFLKDTNYTYMKEVYGNIPQLILHFCKYYLNS